jgi:hypothetical protein
MPESEEDLRKWLREQVAQEQQDQEGRGSAMTACRRG